MFGVIFSQAEWGLPKYSVYLPQMDSNALLSVAALIGDTV